MELLMSYSLVRIALYYLAIINLVTLCLYGIDKRKAQKGKWRIPERTLFLLPIAGGSVGALLGMYLFRHKTRHWYFKFGIPAILLCQMALGIYLYNKLPL